MQPATAKPMTFAPKRPENQEMRADVQPWNILIVDDEQEVHSVTKLALADFRFADRPLRFLHAYSAQDARNILTEVDEIALILLDVVMETDHAGLEFVRHIREDLGNRLTRIVLRTGQPGQAPERKVITEYDINDYKEKTELTSQKLFTVVSASLRSYRDMVALDNSRRGLRKIIDASANIFSLNSMKTFAEGALSQMLSLLHVRDKGSFYSKKVDSLAAFKSGSSFKILAGTGRFSEFNEQALDMSSIPDEIAAHLQDASERGTHLIDSDHIVSYHRGRSGHENLLYVGGSFSEAAMDPSLVELYARNVGIAFENIELHQQIEETQREIVYRLGEAVETRSMETGNHLKRVAEISKLLALGYGLDEEEGERILYASPLHDVGKIGIPDAILNKPGKHTAEEWEIMKTHSQLGYKMLASSEKPILQAGAIIALEHHEKWDGSGYPHGKKGEDIHIYGRITALADVYDALSSKRCYKDPWPLGDVYRFVKEQRGKHFDPALVDILTQNIDRIEHIMMTYEDRFD